MGHRGAALDRRSPGSGTDWTAGAGHGRYETPNAPLRHMGRTSRMVRYRVGERTVIERTGPHPTDQGSARARTTNLGVSWDGYTRRFLGHVACLARWLPRHRRSPTPFGPDARRVAPTSSVGASHPITSRAASRYPHRGDPPWATSVPSHLGATTGSGCRRGSPTTVPPVGEDATTKVPGRSMTFGLSPGRARNG
jgi:hypothetical protein